MVREQGGGTDLRQTQIDFEDHVANILRVWSQADIVDMEEGLVAYARYRETLSRLAGYYSKPLFSVVGAFVALSPNNAYMTNLRAVKSMLEGQRGAGYGDCQLRAKRCLAGKEFLSFTQGLKTRNFYQNILDPGNPHPVTVDGHAFSVWDGRYHRMKDANVVQNPRVYARIAGDYRIAAMRTNVIPQQMQAVTWFTWKRLNRVVVDLQMDMFRAGDQWMLDLQPDEIRTFTPK